MYAEAVFAGMGGHGALLAAQILAHAGVYENKNVVWYPAYGPETRGGIATCTLIISDDQIGAPIATHPSILVAFNQAMLDSFIDKVKPNGTVIINSDLCETPKRTDIKVFNIPATSIAMEIGQPKVLNMVLVGAYTKITGIVNADSVKWALENQLPEKLKKTIPTNLEAISRGIAAVNL